MNNEGYIDPMTPKDDPVEGGSSGLSTKPKTRIHHLLAKIAGSDAAKAIKPKTKNECMLDQIKGLPVATESDAGKSVIVNESGEYALGEGSGGSGGANVLTLYAGEKDGNPWAYKDSERTEEYATFEEAKDAVNNASNIRVIMQPELGAQGVFFANDFVVTEDPSGRAVFLSVLMSAHATTTSNSYTLFEEAADISM